MYIIIFSASSNLPQISPNHIRSGERVKDVVIF